MSVIRIGLDVFSTDSSEYDILTNAVAKIKGVEGAVLEIGTRRGGSAKMIIDTLVENGDANRSMFCIDPYGNIPIECTNLNLKLHYPGVKTEGDPESKEITQPMRFDYSNNMRNRIIPSLYYYAYQAGLNFTFFCLEDNEFFKRYADGVPVYDDDKKIEDKYAFVFFDGPHDNKTVIEEVEFFMSRVNVGATVVFDDIWMYSHEELIDPILFRNGFEVLEKRKIKASYIKTK